MVLVFCRVFNCLVFINSSRLIFYSITVTWLVTPSCEHRCRLDEYISRFELLVLMSYQFHSVSLLFIFLCCNCVTISFSIVLSENAVVGVVLVVTYSTRVYIAIHTDAILCQSDSILDSI